MELDASTVQRVAALRTGGLPLAWKAAIRFCPYCSGTGDVGDGELPCLNCEGTGNLFNSYVKAAYRLGQEDSLVRMRSIRDHAAKAVEDAATDGENEASMLMRLGL